MNKWFLIVALIFLTGCASFDHAGYSGVVTYDGLTYPLEIVTGDEFYQLCKDSNHISWVWSGSRLERLPAGALLSLPQRLIHVPDYGMFWKIKSGIGAEICKIAYPDCYDYKYGFIKRCPVGGSWQAEFERVGEIAWQSRIGLYRPQQ